MLDSGGYRYARMEKLPVTQREVFERQLEILNGRPGVVFQLDFPLLPTLTRREMNERIETTLENADRLMSYMNKPSITAMGIIQGYDKISLINCITKLREIGYTHMALGGLAKASLGIYEPVWEKRRLAILRTVELVAREVPKLHVCGISTPNLIRRFSQVGVSSIDTAAFVKSAFMMQVYYSKPYRRYRLVTSRRIKEKRGFFDRILTRPLPCDCPVCERHGGKVLFNSSKKKWNNLRAIHNLWHYLSEIA